MNFQQLKSLREAARCNFNLTEVANVLFTSQPGVSRQIRELEDELGVDIFVRNGKRLIGLTEPGAGILQIVEKLLQEADNLRRAAKEYSGDTSGTLKVAATHTQARFALPVAVQHFRKDFPDVRIALQQSSPEHIAEWVISGKADIGIATEGLSQFRELASFTCYEWNHAISVVPGHPLLNLGRAVTLDDLAAYPLITYDLGFTGRGHIDAAFQAAGLEPDVILTAMDSDVIQQYVGMGLGVGLVAEMATRNNAGNETVKIDASHLFAKNVTRLAVRRGSYLRGYTLAFIQLLAPQLTQRDILEQVAADAAT